VIETTIYAVVFTMKNVWRYQGGYVCVVCVIRKRTNNTMPKRKGTKWQTVVDKILNRSLKIEQREPLCKRCELRYSRRRSSSCSTSGTRRVTHTFSTKVKQFLLQ